MFKKIIKIYFIFVIYRVFIVIFYLCSRKPKKKEGKKNFTVLYLGQHYIILLQIKNKRSIIGIRQKEIRQEKAEEV